MELINLDHTMRIETASHSSKGNQLKWMIHDNWYKADYMGYESLSEVVVSSLLRYSDIPTEQLIEYWPVWIQYDERHMKGCASHNFLKEGQELIPIERLIRQYTGRSPVIEMGHIPEVKDRIRYLVNSVTDITGLHNFGTYLTTALEIDACFLNEDRHTNNIAVIYQEKTHDYCLCPYFDHGLSLFSDMMVDFPLESDMESCMKRMEAKPFSRNFDEQLDCAEELYGRQIFFLFGEKEISQSIAPFQGIYDPRILLRVEEVLRQQRRKYQYLFTKPVQ